MKNIILIVLTLFICSSCGEDFFETTLKVDPPPHEDQLVLQSFLKSNDSLLYVSLSRSTGILGADAGNYGPELINDATVELFENGTLKHTFELSGDFVFNYKVELPDVFGGIGNNYELRATHDELGVATAEQTMIAPPSIVSATFDAEGGFPTEYGDRTNAIDIVIDDPAGENYYEVYLAAIEGDNIYSRYAESFDVNASEGIDGAILIDAASFDGKTYTLQIDTEYDYEDNMKVVVRSISKDWFLYSRSLNAFSESEGFGLFSEPVTVHTNVENGLGVFAMGAELRIPVEEE